MKFEEIEKQVIALAKPQRIDFVCRLLYTLPPPGTDVSKEEVARRDAELDNGEVQEL
jgi:hypothetical protein